MRYVSHFLIAVTSVFLCSSSILAQDFDRTKYLALGDSVPFGFTPLVNPPQISKYKGFPELVSAALGRPVANLSCFGEASGSFLTGFGPDLGCSKWKEDGLPMHTQYDRPSQSQSELAMKVLSLRPKNIELVTLMVGGNDLGLLLAKCSPTGTLDTVCALQNLPGVLINFKLNLMEIYKRIRATGYKGKIVAVNYYAFNYNPADPFTAALTALNAVTLEVSLRNGARVADSFGLFGLASLPYGGNACTAGLLVKLPNGTCDTHPSLKGQGLLAASVLKALFL